jgi:hypothetical protein
VGGGKSGEREVDGAYSPRDSRHGGGGEDHDHGFDHEAILGSRREAEEFDELAPQEAKRRLKILLGKMDRNLDESIDRLDLECSNKQVLVYTVHASMTYGFPRS